jgi:hypothetical protein
LIRNFENELKIQNSNWKGADYAIKEAMLFKIHILITNLLIKFCEKNDYRISPDPMNGFGKEIIQMISKGVLYNTLTKHLEKRLFSLKSAANTTHYKPVLPISYVKNSSSIFPFSIRQKSNTEQENSTQVLPTEDLDLLKTFSKNPSWKEFCKLSIESQYLIVGRYYYNDYGWSLKKKFDLIQQFENEFQKQNTSWSAHTGHDVSIAIEEAIQIKIQIQETISYIRAMEAVKNNQENSGTEELRMKLLDKLRIELSQLYDAYPPLNTYSEEKPLKEEFIFEVSPQEEEDLNSDDDSCCTLYCTII